MAGSEHAQGWPLRDPPSPHTVWCVCQFSFSSFNTDTDISPSAKLSTASSFAAFPHMAPCHKLRSLDIAKNMATSFLRRLPPCVTHTSPVSDHSMLHYLPADCDPVAQPSAIATDGTSTALSNSVDPACRRTRGVVYQASRRFDPPVSLILLANMV